MSDQEAHVDAYTFIDQVEAGKRIQDVLRDVFEQNPETVRFTGQFSGPFLGFLAMRISGLAEAHELANGAFWDAGLRCETGYVIKASTLRIPKRGSPDVCALVRARADDPEALLDSLDEVFAGRHEEQEPLPYEERTFNYGAAVVSGAFDLLIDVGSPTLPTTIELVREVRSVAGIGKTVTSFAHLPGNARRRDL
jgi:hypothetical protein